MSIYITSAITMVDDECTDGGRETIAETPSSAAIEHAEMVWDENDEYEDDRKTRIVLVLSDPDGRATRTTAYRVWWVQGSYFDDVETGPRAKRWPF